MRISKEELLSQSEVTGFRAEMLEKVIHLLGLLQSLRNHPYLKGRWALKGGTALNLFVFDSPRLSVDIDLNYIGSVERETMLSERPKFEEAIKAVCKRENLAIRRLPYEHAGGKWLLRYDSALGQGGSLEIDINYMLRIPLWPPKTMNSCALGPYGATKISVLDIHELAAGKLAALFARQTPRDLFDVGMLMNAVGLDNHRLRLAFVIYGAMSRKDWRAVTGKAIAFDQRDFVQNLQPLLRGDVFSESTPEHMGRRLIDDCQRALHLLLPFTEGEQEFLDRLLDHGEIKPSSITSDEAMAERIARHPMLEWKAQNVREYRDQGVG